MPNRSTRHKVGFEEGLDTEQLAARKFVAKWQPGTKASGLGERAGAQQHFLDLCRLLGVEEPSDPDNYCFERSFHRLDKSRGFADVWKRGCFAWEFKAPGQSLEDALRQLMLYALPLENPPLLVVSDRSTTEIHTHFTGYASEKTVIAHDQILQPETRAALRAVFTAPLRFRPKQTAVEITRRAAVEFAEIAERMQARGIAPQAAAHFLTQCLFCMFAQDSTLLKTDLFKSLTQNRRDPSSLRRGLQKLFVVMRTGGDFGVEDIPWFNGGLFEKVDVPPLDAADVEAIKSAAKLDWRGLDPTIFGTLFERGLDPRKRRQLGAHYTDPDTISKLVRPVIEDPLSEEWAVVKVEIKGLLGIHDELTGDASAKDLRRAQTKVSTPKKSAMRQAQDRFNAFLERLRNFRVLDPACGSGNFLYLALKALKDVEHRVNFEAEELGLHRQIPVTGPQNVLGLELNAYAAELSRVTVWIGELQWRMQHGFGWKENPILDPLDQIECRDALLNRDGAEAPWPSADVVVGNPPFVGVSRKRKELGGAYVDQLDSVFAPRVPGGADLVCYWFDKALRQIESRNLRKAGLVATNSIRGGASRSVLDRARRSRIFAAWSDEPWINEGAAVRVSLVCFGDGGGMPKLNGEPVEDIYPDLTASKMVGVALDLTTAAVLLENAEASFQGASKKGKFEISGELARTWLRLPNPNRRPNSDVIKPWANGLELTRRPQDLWIIDFGTQLSEKEAALYEAPFAYLSKTVKAERIANNREAYRKFWWRFAEPRPGLRRALAGLPRYIATVAHSKHRVFVWLPITTSPDQALITAARADDVTFGILQSRFHTLWALRMGSSLEDRPRYTPTTTFETYPFPEGLTPADTTNRKTEYVRGDDVLLPAGLPSLRRAAALSIAVAAKALVDLRNEWLNPSALTRKSPEVKPIGLEKSPFPMRLAPREGCEKDLSRRTMTSLYNEMPTWLRQAHEALDSAVADAYGWNDYTASKITDDAILQRLLDMNRKRAAVQPGAQSTLALRTDPALKVVAGQRESGQKPLSSQAKLVSNGRKSVADTAKSNRQAR